MMMALTAFVLGVISWRANFTRFTTERYCMMKFTYESYNGLQQLSCIAFVYSDINLILLFVRFVTFPPFVGYLLRYLMKKDKEAIRKKSGMLD